MSEDDFTKVLSKVIITFEKAGVYNDTLKESMDILFELKESIFLREEIMKGNNTCHYCKHYNDRYCNKISGELLNKSEIEILGQSPINGRIKLMVNPYWSCSHFKK